MVAVVAIFVGGDAIAVFVVGRHACVVVVAIISCFHTITIRIVGRHAGIVVVAVVFRDNAIPIVVDLVAARVTPRITIRVVTRAFLVGRLFVATPRDEQVGASEGYGGEGLDSVHGVHGYPEAGADREPNRWPVPVLAASGGIGVAGEDLHAGVDEVVPKGGEFGLAPVGGGRAGAGAADAVFRSSFRRCARAGTEDPRAAAPASPETDRTQPRPSMQTGRCATRFGKLCPHWEWLQGKTQWNTRLRPEQRRMVPIPLPFMDGP